MVKPGIGEYTTLIAIAISLAFIFLSRFYAVVVCVAALVAFGIYIKWCYGFFTRMGLSGPTPYPPLGNLWSVFTGPGFHESTSINGTKYGKLYGSFVGLIPTFNTWDAELCKDIMVKEFSKFPNRMDPIIDHDISKEKDPPLIDNMITLITGQKWKDVRNTITPSFTTGKLKHMMPYMNESGSTLMEIMLNDSNEGKVPLDIKKYMSGYTMDVVASVALGVKVDSLRNPDDPVVKHASAVNNFSFKNPFILFFFSFPWLSRKLRKWFGFQSFRLQGEDFFKDLLKRVVQGRKQNPKIKDPDFLQLMLNAANETNIVSEKPPKGDNQTESAYEPHVSTGWNEERKYDVKVIQLSWKQRIQKPFAASNLKSNTSYLSMTIVYTPSVPEYSVEITDGIIMSQAFVFLVAGFDTTAATLQFVAYALATHPDVQQRCYEEILEEIGRDVAVSYDGIQKLDYMECVILETLRMYPVAPLNARVAAEDYHINDNVVIPKGGVINILTYKIHHSDEYYPEPEEFKPERFTQEERKNRHPCAFLPFGFGPRNCIGMRFALLEMKVALLQLLLTFRILPSETTEVPLKLQSTNLLRPQKPIMLKFVPRAA